MKYKRILSVLLWSFLIIGEVVLGQEKIKNKWYLELEPLQFANNGWSVVGHYAIHNQLHIGSNLFASTLSEGLNDWVWNTNGKISLQAQQKIGVNVSIRYFFKAHPNPKGWLVSLPLGWERWTLTDLEVAESQDYRFWYLSPRIGYLWFPFTKARVYLIGEASAILPIQTNGVLSYSNGNINIRSLIPFPSVGLGISF